MFKKNEDKKKEYYCTHLDIACPYHRYGTRCAYITEENALGKENMRYMPNCSHPTAVAKEDVNDAILGAMEFLNLRIESVLRQNKKILEELGKQNTK